MACRLNFGSLFVFVLICFLASPSSAEPVITSTHFEPIIITTNFATQSKEIGTIETIGGVEIFSTHAPIENIELNAKVFATHVYSEADRIALLVGDGANSYIRNIRSNGQRAREHDIVLPTLDIDTVLNFRSCPFDPHVLVMRRDGSGVFVNAITGDSIFIPSPPNRPQDLVANYANIDCLHRRVLFGFGGSTLILDINTMTWSGQWPQHNNNVSSTLPELGPFIFYGLHPTADSEYYLSVTQPLAGLGRLDLRFLDMTNGRISPVHIELQLRHWLEWATPLSYRGSLGDVYVRDGDTTTLNTRIHRVTKSGASVIGISQSEARYLDAVSIP